MPALVVAAVLAAAAVLIRMGGGPDEHSDAHGLDGAKTQEGPVSTSSGIDARADRIGPKMVASTENANRLDGSETSASTMTANRTADHNVAANPEKDSQSSRKHGAITDAFDPASQAKKQAATAFPEDAEEKIWQALAANQHLNFTSIDRVECRETVCEIRFTGGPDLSDSGPFMKLWLPLSSVLPMIKSGGASSRVEVSPGVYRSVVTIRSYIGNDSLKDSVSKPAGRAD